MKQLLKISGLLFFLLLIQQGMAQSFGENVIGVDETQKKNELPVLFQPRLSLSLGSAFTSYAPGYSTFATFIAPRISMPVAKKFDVSVGIGYHSLFHSSSNESVVGQNPSHYGSLFVSGTYHVNEKLSVRGTGYKTFMLNSGNLAEKKTSNYLDFSNQGFILDMEYRITDHFKINASFQYHEQNNGFYYGQPYNSFGSDGFYNPGIGSIGGFGPGF